MTTNNFHGEKYLLAAFPEIRNIVKNKRQLLNFQKSVVPKKAKYIIHDFLSQLNIILSYENSKDWYFSYFQQFCIQEDSILDSAVIRILDLDEEEIKEMDKHRHTLYIEHFNVQKETAYMWFDLIFNSYIYPTWLKYWALKGLEKMAFNANKKKIIRRKKSSLLDFPELVPEVFNQTMQTMMNAIQNDDYEYDNPKIEFIFSKEYKNKKPDFWDVYGHFYQEAIYNFQDLYVNTDGVWIDYIGIQDSFILYNSLLNYPVAWCIKSEVYCKKILEDQKVCIYYTQDNYGNFEVPRMAIVYSQNPDLSVNIEQFRGVEEYQNLDIFMYKEQSYLDKFLEIRTSEEFLEFLEEILYMINIVENKLLNPKFEYDESSHELLNLLLNEDFSSRFSFISKERIKLFLDKSQKKS